MLPPPLLPVQLLLLLACVLMVGSVAAVQPASFPWSRVPLKASPGIGRPELIDGNRSAGALTDPEVTWLARHHSIVILSGATQVSAHALFAEGSVVYAVLSHVMSRCLLGRAQDPTNKSVCAELKIADAARRLKAANPTVRVFVYFPSSKDESAIQGYCGESVFSGHPEWRVKYPNGSDFVNSGGSYVHDLTQPVVRAWWIAAATNASFFRWMDGVFADNAIANNDQLISPDGVRPSKTLGAALLAGQQALYSELRVRLRELGGNRTVIFNGIRQGQHFSGIPNLLPHADGKPQELCST